ncbi:Rpn family recombination-promoting nuclease/putative transposase [Pseudogracilibacillus sp. SO30301A]|uniref:Rpn family recombination-promoting nuclease/putative transposase n=1 Tax=Pseudogracilibacillus sp. SO30301A TaxID=3098291 RepID=UPI00300DFDCC
MSEGVGTINNPHDKYFKETLGNIEIAEDFIKNYLPDEILGIIELSTLKPKKDSFISKDLEETFSDLLFSVTINGYNGYIYFLFEHKSYLSTNVSFQLLKYMIEIWENKIKKENSYELPIVIPLVIYHGQKSWDIAKTLGDVIVGYNDLTPNIQKYVPNYEYLIYDLNSFGMKDIKGKVELRIFLDIIKHIQSPDEEQFIASFKRGIEAFLKLKEKPTVMGYFKPL